MPRVADDWSVTNITTGWCVGLVVFVGFVYGSSYNDPNTIEAGQQACV